MYGSTYKIWRFKTGKLRVKRRKAKSMLVRKYNDATGKSRFVGQKSKLKHSASLVCRMTFFVLHALF